MPERTLCELCGKQEATHVAKAAWVIARADGHDQPIEGTDRFIRSKEDKNGGVMLCADCVEPFIAGA